MKNLTFYTDKKNNFKYKLNVQGDGASLSTTTSRLCLEFKNGLNLYVKSKINETSGQCIAELPSLEFLGESEGKLRVETIANKTYFPLFESDFVLKQSVKVAFEINEDENVDESIEETNEITFGIQIDDSNFKEEKLNEEKPEKKPKKKKKEVEEIINEKTKKEDSTLKSFDEWQNND